MSRLAMDGNSSIQGGMSRIPRFAPSNRSMLQSNMFNNQQPLPGVGASQNPSRLEQMQVEYQKNILKQKEEKLINMYEDQQKRALKKVNQNRGMVRDFFEERRVNSGSSTKSVVGPTMDQLYQRKKQEHRYGTQTSYNTSSAGSRQTSGSRFGYDLKNSPEVINRNMGRDRAKPLAPIQPNSDNSENPFARRKPQIVRPRTYKDKPQNREYSNNVAMPRSAPNGYSQNENYDNDFDDSPPPNNEKLQHLQQKRKMLQNQRLSNKALTAQRNQPTTRKTPPVNRNSNYEYQTSEEDEGYDEVNEQSEGRSSNDEMKRKQAELMAQIESQQRELERLRQEREVAEVEERRERERRKRVEEERRQKMIEEEKRREKDEEEERIRQQWEEEKYKKMELEKKRMRDVSRNSNISSTENKNNYYDNQSPTPPPQPRPTNTRKVVPQKQPQKQPQKRPPQDQPVVSGDHTALYEQAGNIDGAYEDTGRLAACHNCGRSFAEDRLAKHEKACKNATKKRKTLDATKLRTRGTEMEQYVAHRQPTPPKAKKKKDWRAEHESFIQAIRYAKKAKAIEESGGNLADLPPPPRSENPDYVKCPYCDRKFNESAAERHIPHCKNTANRPKPPPQRRR